MVVMTPEASEAEVTETTYTASAATKHEITRRLVARRVRRQPPPGQDELLPAYRYHALFTDTASPPWTPT